MLSKAFPLGLLSCVASYKLIYLFNFIGVQLFYNCCCVGFKYIAEFQLYIYIHTHIHIHSFPDFFSRVDYYRILNSVPCAIQ